MTMARSSLLEVQDLTIDVLGEGSELRVVDGVSFYIDKGETLALVGESGSGKSLTALSLLRLLPRQARISGGQIRFDGQDLVSLDTEAMRRVRGERIAMVFQDPLSSLNPSLTVGYQVAEALRFRRGLSRRAARAQVIGALTDVGIPDAARRVDDYPHQFSGGARQRIMIAMALCLRPPLVVADEPTTALDVTVQAQILRLLADLQRREQIGLILISHDLAVVAGTADRIAVMYAGRVVETGAARAVCDRPAHPYTLGLLRSLPTVGREDAHLTPIEGYPPDFAHLPTGCSFHVRCPFVQDRCRVEPPPVVELGEGRRSECHRANEVYGDD